MMDDLRYLVFTMCDYYPQGGLGDLVEIYADKDEAIKRAKEEYGDYKCVMDMRSVIDGNGHHTLLLVWDNDY